MSSGPGLLPCGGTWPVLSCLGRHSFPEHGPAFTFSSLHSRTARTSDTCRVSDKPVAGKSPKEPRPVPVAECRRVPNEIPPGRQPLPYTQQRRRHSWGPTDASNRLCSWTRSQTDTGSEQRPPRLCRRPPECSGAQRCGQSPVPSGPPTRHHTPPQTLRCSFGIY